MLPVCSPWWCMWGSGGITFLKLGTRLDWVLAFTLCPIYVWGKISWYTSKHKAGWGLKSVLMSSEQTCAFQDMTSLCVIFARHFAHFTKCGKLGEGGSIVQSKMCVFTLKWIECCYIHIGQVFLSSEKSFSIQVKCLHLQFCRWPFISLWNSIHCHFHRTGITDSIAPTVV